MAPFLNVITRHIPARKQLLARNQASLQAQTDPDWESRVMVDDCALGFAGARDMLIRADDSLTGQYVLILDDDDVMQATDGIAALKRVVTAFEREAGRLPPVIIFKGYHSAELGVLPRSNWGRAPVQGDIGAFDFILRTDVFKDCVTAQGSSDYAHDFGIIAAAYERHVAEVVWLDKVICAADKRRMGAAA